ncbi:MAG: phosphoglucosamine mutase [Planctomycetes bacterium]|nr:phosphoglucosamine mutase [Planctomycetota bacterium]
MTDEPTPRPEFGTDGLRGPAGQPPLDPDTLRRVGAAFGLWLQRQGPERKRVVIANDGRDSSSWILECLAQGLSSTEVSSTDIGLATTPALAWITRSGSFAAGIMISASHNPATDNGIKLFADDGHKISDAAQDEIADLAPKLDLGELTTPRAKEESSLLTRYQERLANSFVGLDLSGKTIVVDAANGGGSDLAPSTLRALGADVVAMHCEPDGWNINEDCGALHPDGIVETVIASGAVLGICLDGDGDRGIFVDDRGRIRDGDDCLLTIGAHLAEHGRLADNTVVTTVMSNLGMHKALRGLGIDIAVTPVGDRHVTQCMRDRGLTLGAETSGHVIFAEDGYLAGDGLYTALQLLALPQTLENGSAAAFLDFERFPQILLNVPVESKPPLDDVPAVIACREEIERSLGDDGRVVLRYSGTENLCRVMVEGPVEDDVQRFAARLASVVEDSLRT